jgi:hypothetical protein
MMSAPSYCNWVAVRSAIDPANLRLFVLIPKKIARLKARNPTTTRSLLAQTRVNISTDCCTRNVRKKNRNHYLFYPMPNVVIKSGISKQKARRNNKLYRLIQHDHFERQQQTTFVFS